MMKLQLTMRTLLIKWHLGMNFWRMSSTIFQQLDGILTLLGILKLRLSYSLKWDLMLSILLGLITKIRIPALMIRQWRCCGDLRLPKVAKTISSQLSIIIIIAGLTTFALMSIVAMILFDLINDSRSTILIQWLNNSQIISEKWVSIIEQQTSYIQWVVTFNLLMPIKIIKTWITYLTI